MTEPPTQPPPRDDGSGAPADPSTDGPEQSRPEVAWGPPRPPAPGVPVPGSPDFVFGGVGGRLAAWWVDTMLIAVAAFIAALVLTGTLGFDTAADSRSIGILYWVLYVAGSALYFVLLWTSPARATIGMRLVNLQVGRAFDGAPLGLGPALIRWALLGAPFVVLVLIPELATVGSLLWLVWPFVLLMSTATSPTRQGIHDRAAGSAVVRPATAGTSGAAIACIVTAVIIAVFAVLSVVAIAFLGGQAAEILEEVGRSV